jgi:type I restriction enzyme S subunit
MSLLRYPEYKDSGVAWLGEIPVHWTEVALSRVLAAPVTDGPHTTPTFIDEGIPFLSVDGIQDGELVFEGCRYISHEDHIEFSRKACPRKGDILMGKAASIGKIARVKMDTVFDIWSPLALIRSDEDTCGAVFLEYALKSKESQAQIETKANSNTQLNIGMKDIPKLRICLPSINEQQAIATFLDRETDKIDALIAEQKRLVELLAEKRQAVISHAVTKGLNPNAPMKDSGIEWLGEVPKHWEILPIKRLASIRYGIGEPPKYQTEGTPLIRATNIHAGRLYEDGLVYVNPNDIPENRIAWLEVDDIIVVRSGAYTGDSAIIPPEFGQSIAGFDMVLRCHSIRAAFMQFALLSRYLKEGQIDLEKMRAAQPHLNAEELGSCLLVAPPQDEQQSITAYLGIETAKFDTLTAEASRAITLLQERRSALISAAVTGKIDVQKVSLKEMM